MFQIIPKRRPLRKRRQACAIGQLENVRHLLRPTSLSITEICRLCRFRSENHLKRLFKQAFGQTMSDYRNA